MIISTKAWLEYIRKMSAISEQAANEMQKWIQKNGFGDDQALLEYAFALSTKYGEAIGALACDMYEKIAEAQGVTIPPAEMADTPEFGEVAKAVHGTMIESLNKVDATVGRLVKQTGADTILKNAKRDGAYFAWVAHGDTCPYCLMLSAIGWQKAGKNTIRGKHADHIHPHCDCQYVVDFKGDLKVEGYDPEKMQREIMDIVDPDENEYAGFEDFIGRYGRQTWSRKGRDNTGLNMIRRRFYIDKYKGVPKTWVKIEMPANEALDGTNPQYNRHLGSGGTKEQRDFNDNCSNCVPAYEMRLRGYNVTAQPVSKNKTLMHHPFSAWEEVEVLSVESSDGLTRELLMYEDGSRFQINKKGKRSIWSEESGHTFAAQKNNGEIVFIDPQIGAIIDINKSVSSTQEFEYARIDNAEISDRGKSACKKVQ